MQTYFRRAFQYLEHSIKKSIVSAGFVSILILVASQAFVTVVFAQDGDLPAPGPVILTDEQGEYPLGFFMEILEDSSGELSIDQVSSPEFDSQFTSSQVAAPILGYTDSAIWVRLQLHNKTRLIDHWLLDVNFPNMHYVDLYSPLPGGSGFTIKQSGVLRPPATRDVRHPHIIFNLVVPTLTQQTYYLRFKSGASMTLPLTLWNQETFIENNAPQERLAGVFYGILIGLLVYNLFLLFSLREASYFYLVSFLAISILFIASYDGYAEIYLFTDYYYLKPYYFPLLYVLMAVSVLLFADTILEIKTRLSFFHRVNLVLLSIGGILALLIPFTSYHFLSTPSVIWAILTCAILILEGVILWRKGYTSVRYYVIAWFGFLAGIILVNLVRMGLVPSNLITESFARLGLAWAAVSWSIALADRINLMKNEADITNRKLSSSEHRLAQILEGMPLGVSVYGADQKIQYVNRRRNEILSNPAGGGPADPRASHTLEQVAESFGFEVAGSGEKYPLERLPVYSALQGRPSSVDDLEAHIGGRTIPLEMWANPVWNEAGKVESAVLVIQDITERKQAAAELTEYQQHLESLVEARTEEFNLVNQQLQQQIVWLSEVNKVHQSIAGVANLEGAYDELSARILELTGASLVFILRWEEAGEKSEVVNCSLRGAETCEINNLKDLFQIKSPLRNELASGNIKTWTEDQAASLPEPVREFLKENDIRLLFLSPMVVRNLCIGVLGVAFQESLQDAMRQQLDLVERMALDLAKMAGDAIVLDQALDHATVEERNRLARDLHDSVTQVLFSATLLAEVLPKIWERDPEQGIQKVEKLRDLTRGALAEMRTLLLELRPSAVFNIPLSELLTQLTEAISSRSGLKFQLSIEKVPLLPEKVQEGFYHIAQEALNNVVKHAQAELVLIDLSISSPSLDSSGGMGYEVKLVIQDNGVGYSSGDSHPSRLGLEIMRERAAAIHASLSQESQPGYGSRVTLIWCGEIGSKNG